MENNLTLTSIKTENHIGLILASIGCTAMVGGGTWVAFVGPNWINMPVAVGGVALGLVGAKLSDHAVKRYEQYCYERDLDPELTLLINNLRSTNNMNR